MMLLRRFFFFLCLFFAALFLFLYFVFPTRHFQSVISAPIIQNCYGMALFATLLFSIASFLFHQVLDSLSSKSSSIRSAPTPKAVPTSTKRTRAFLLLQVCFVALIMGRLAFHLDNPLDWDENLSASVFHRLNVWEVANPFLGNQNFPHNINQPLGLVSAYLSAKSFGMNEFSLRIPALFFSVLFLVALNIYGRMLFSSFTVILLNVHLFANQLSLWYMNSLKGYISMMLFSFSAFSVLLLHTQKKISDRRLSPFLFFTFFGCAIFSQTFGSIFCLLLIFSLLAWLFLNRHQLDAESLQFHVKVLLGCLLFLPLIAVVFSQQVINMDKVFGNFFSDENPSLSQALMNSFGLGYTWLGKILFLLATLLVIKQFSREEWKHDFTSIFLGSSILFITAIASLLKVSILEGRYFLVFLVPIVAWLGERTNDLRPQILQWGLKIALVLVLGLGSWSSGNGIYQVLTVRNIEFRDFIKTVRQKTPSTSTDCFTFSGDPYQSAWAKHVYFAPRKLPQKHVPTCTKKFHLFFATAPYTTEKFVREPSSLGTFTEVYNNSKGMVLYEVIDDIQSL